MNFLDQLKSASARKASISVETTDSNEALPPPTLKPNNKSATPRNFLDELKARARPT